MPCDTKSKCCYNYHKKGDNMVSLKYYPRHRFLQPTVHLRVRRLTAAGIITKFTISIDNNLLGYDHLAFMGINIKPGFADQTTEELSNLEDILEIHKMHNSFDLFLKIRATDLNHMRDIIENKIRKLPHILETELMTVLKTKKEDQISYLNKDISDSNDKDKY